MNNKRQRPDKTYIWVNIDFDKVKHRIDAVRDLQENKIPIKLE